MLRRLLRQLVESIRNVNNRHTPPRVAALTSEQVQARELGKRLAAGDWKDGQIGFEEETIQIDGANVWQYRWEYLHADVQLFHPVYRWQPENFRIYRIKFNGQEIVFAACELSPNVWGFYVPV